MPDTPADVAPAIVTDTADTADRANTANTADRAGSAGLPDAADTAEHSVTAGNPGTAARGSRRGRGGRSPAGGGKPAAAAGNARPPARAVHPALEQLAALYPRHFGAEFLPLKRGIFQDLRDAHPDAFTAEDLKEALGQHTRSTKYLQSVAAARPRHDLAGEPVEALAAEHVYQALMELWRRRGNRTPEAGKQALRDEWRQRIVRAFEASGLSREAYAEKVRTRDEAAGALLDEALAESAERAARDEALLRAFEAGNTTVEAFADMYGLDPRQAPRLLDAARRRREVSAAA
ncbi:Fertility inhibition FinO [Xylophilus sp. Kf1]|nr:Fertility inhibition FinO [Xylophilus sp. Kf1]